MTDRGLTLRELAAHGGRPSSRPSARSSRPGSRRWASTTVLDLLEHYPRRYVDRTRARRDRRARRSARRRRSTPRCARSTSRRTRDGKRTIVERRRLRRHRPARARVLQPGVARAAAAGRARRCRCSARSSSYRGKRQMTNPVVDVLADARRRTRLATAEAPARIVPVYPQSGKAEVHTWQLRRAVASCARAHEGARLRRSARRRRPRRARPRRPRRARTGTSTGPRPMHDASAAAHRLKFDEFLRMQLALVARKRALAAEATGIRHVGRRPARARVPRRAPVPAHRRPGRARSSEITADLAAPGADAPAAAGRGRARARRSSRSPRCSPRCRAATRARSWRRPRCSPSSTSSPCARCSAGSSCPPRARCSASGRCGVALLTNRTPAAERRRIAEGLRDGRASTSSSGTHALIYGGVEFAAARRRGDRRAAPLRRRAARPAARQGRRARRARDDGDADPAHRGDAHLRRPRQDRAARAAGGPVADRHRGGRRRAARARRRCTSRCATEVAAGRQAYVVCPLVEGSDKLEARAATEELERLARRGARRPAPRPAARPDAGGRQGGGDGARSAPARSTCSWRRR